MPDVQKDHEQREDCRFPLRLVLIQADGQELARLNPDDAAPVGIVDGARCRLVSRSGSIELSAKLTYEVTPGTVAIPDGWDHKPNGTFVRLEALVLPAGSTAHIFGPP
jgi:anaerobic selenocysteine-containing dehydrogenase